MVEERGWALLGAVVLVAACGGGGVSGGDAGGGTGQVTGSVLTPAGGVITGALVTVTPTGGTAVTQAQIDPDSSLYTQADGSFSSSPVPVGAGTVKIGNLPRGCTAPSAPYSALADGNSVTVSITATCNGPVSASGLWSGGQLGYALSTLEASANNVVNSPTSDVSITAPDVICPPKAAVVGAEAFDAQGALWTQRPNDNEDSIIQFTATQLADDCSSPSTPPTRVVFGPGGATLQALAFDSAGNLWAADVHDDQLLGFAVAQLVNGGTSNAPVKPKWALSTAGNTPVEDLYSPTGLAFDSSGNLWVANDFSILEYTAASITSTDSLNGGNSPGPALTLTTANDITIANAATTSTNAPAVYPSYSFVSITFDASGNLWAAGQANLSATSQVGVVVEFTKGMLVGSGPQMPTFVTVHQSGASEPTGLTYGALVFDQTGTLWLGGNELSDGRNLLGFSASDLVAKSGPSIVINPAGLSFGASLAIYPPL